ncbi:MAG: fumarate reductase/succinate dehydrogenase flavoprotein domain protein [Caulobacteraceae bacterium]|nr:fumarate reductase/succinate dehydrogenase flavoprotein domain protein [Caulobacteraceae bacterium]
MGLDRRRLLAGGGAVFGALAAVDEAAAAAPKVAWGREADVVVVGSGASGMTAAIVARQAGASVILLETEPHIGGHAMVSGGHVALGGGTSQQKKYGIADSPDLLFQDLTDWALVEQNGSADYRYNDRELLRAFADHAAETFEWLRAQGVVFMDKAPDAFGGVSVGNSAAREHHVAVMDWPMAQTGRQAPVERRAVQSSGNGLMRPLEVAARKAGVQILTEHRMTDLHREAPRAGRITGVAAIHQGKVLHFKARKGVMLATGGSTGNVNFRRMIDPRLTEEYCGLAGMPWSNQDASGEIAAMAAGASLWGLANQASEFGWTVTKAGRVGSQYGYTHLGWEPGSPVFDRARAAGLQVADWQNAILVNMLGERFYDETADGYPSNTYDTVKAHKPYSARSAADITYAPTNFLNAALAGFQDGHNGGGPIWAIFDADAAAREGWSCAPPRVDTAQGFFFQADSLAELARKIVMRHQRRPMPPENLERAVARYNGFVDVGRDEDFGTPKPRYRIAKAPFYAAWATPVLHDTRSGLRINARGQVIDLAGEVIPGLYSGGETAGGFSSHGLARATCQGFIAGRNLASA